MSSYGIEIENSDGTYTQVGVILGVSEDEARAAARERITRRKDQLDPQGKVVMREKNSGVLLFKDGETYTVERYIS